MSMEADHVDTDLQPRFRWRWREHGIYLGVCVTLGACAAVLRLMPESNRTDRPLRPLELISTRYPLAAEPAVDPNGPVATYYRLRASVDAQAWLDQVPPDIARLVRDLDASADAGPRQRPVAGGQRALEQSVEVDRTRVRSSGERVNLRIALRSSGSRTGATSRAPVAAHLVVDTSSAMDGEALAAVRRAASRLLQRLGSEDRISLTTFAGSAIVRIPDGLVGPRRQAVLEALDQLRIGGESNLNAGLAAAYAEAVRETPADGATRLLFVVSTADTGGKANRRSSQAVARVKQAFQSGVQTSTFGVGQGLDPRLLQQLADVGAGSYRHVTAKTGAGFFVDEIERHGSVVAASVELRIRPAKGIIVAEPPSPTGRVGTGDPALLAIPQFGAADEHTMLMGVQVPAGRGTRDLATVELRYRDRERQREVAEAQILSIDYDDGPGPTRLSPTAQSIAATAKSFEAGKALLAASEAVPADGWASRSLAANATLLEDGARALEDETLAWKAARLAGLERALVARKVVEPVALSQVLRRAGHALLR